MGFVRATSTKQLGEGKMVGVEAGGNPILVVNLKGKYYAIGNICTHMGCMLSDGALKGENVQCPCHGSVFDVKTGEVIKAPANKPVLAFQVKVEGDQILVNV